MASAPTIPPAFLNFDEGSVFLVKIHPVEASRGLLIPGHRLEAFRNIFVPSWKLELLDEKGGRFPLRKVPLSGSDAWLFFLLFGKALFLDELKANDPKNLTAIEQAEGKLENALLRIGAFDLGDFYASHGVEAGDYLCFRQADGEGIQFVIETLRASSIDPVDRARHFAGMGLGFKKAMENLRFPGLLGRTLREALRCAPEELRLEPRIAISDFINEGGLMEMQEYMGVDFLWEHLDDPDAFFEPLLAEATEKAKAVKPPSSRAPGSSRAPRSSRVSGSKSKRSRRRPPPLHFFTVEARIDAIYPPIRRLLSVPGNRTLGELHDILQLVFGWSGSHLHGFVIGEKIYGEPSDEDSEPVEDEASVRLDELGLRKGSHFHYDYDYGDDWRHELHIKGVAKAIPELADRVTCLEGSRAGPPEDSGGVPGYGNLMDIWEKQPRLRSEEERAYLSWADASCGDGKWDPEHFDLAKLQSALDRLS